MTVAPGAAAGPVGSAAISAGFQGADVGAIDRVAAEARRGADRLDQTTTWMSGVVVSLRQASWFTGGASAAYADHLESVVVPWLRTSAQAMRRAADVLVDQAQQQRDASDDRLLGGYTTPPLPTGDTRRPGSGSTRDERRSWWRGLVPSGAQVNGLLDRLGDGLGGVAATVRLINKHLVNEVEVWVRRGRRTIRDGSVWMWRNATPRFVRRLADPEGWSRLTQNPLVRRAGAIGVVMTGIGQIAEDWNDPALTTGQRIARVGATVIFDGGGTLLGGAAGLVVVGGGTGVSTAGIGAIAGAVAGTVIGGELGGRGGRLLREQLTDEIVWMGDRIDDGIEWVGDRVRGVRDSVDRVRGWFRAAAQPAAATPVQFTSTVGGGLRIDPLPAAVSTSSYTASGPSWLDAPTPARAASPDVDLRLPVTGALAPIGAPLGSGAGAPTPAVARFVDGTSLGVGPSSVGIRGEVGP